jgi:NAD(P)-dependent dehydrogenase (short-subunit alcohol dehydrogenase family)
MSRRLENQVAWISGAGSGIGAGTARLFAAEGARVVLADLRPEACRAVAADIEKAGGRAIAIECDVSREDDVRRAMAATESAFGGLSIVVNNAGINIVGLAHELTEAQWDSVMGVNVKGMFFAVKHAIPLLRRNPRSWVVNVGSISSLVGQLGTPAYTTSKAAVLGFTRSIAVDYAAIGLRCNCVCPGITDTPLLREHLDTTPDPEATLQARLRRVPIGVALTPLDIARTILYLACDDSAGVTGTHVVIDGGYLAAAEWEHPGHTAFMEPA